MATKKRELRSRAKSIEEIIRSLTGYLPEEVEKRSEVHVDVIKKIKDDLGDMHHDQREVFEKMLGELGKIPKGLAQVHVHEKKMFTHFARLAVALETKLKSTTDPVERAKIQASLNNVNKAGVEYGTPITRPKNLKEVIGLMQFGLHPQLTRKHGLMGGISHGFKEGAKHLLSHNYVGKSSFEQAKEDARREQKAEEEYNQEEQAPKESPIIGDDKPISLEKEYEAEQERVRLRVERERQEQEEKERQAEREKNKESLTLKTEKSIHTTKELEKWSAKILEELKRIHSSIDDIDISGEGGGKRKRKHRKEEPWTEEEKETTRKLYEEGKEKTELATVSEATMVAETPATVSEATMIAETPATVSEATMVAETPATVEIPKEPAKVNLDLGYGYPKTPTSFKPKEPAPLSLPPVERIAQAETIPKTIDTEALEDRYELMPTRGGMGRRSESTSRRGGGIGKGTASGTMRLAGLPKNLARNLRTSAPIEVAPTISETTPSIAAPAIAPAAVTAAAPVEALAAAPAAAEGGMGVGSMLGMGALGVGAKTLLPAAASALTPAAATAAAPVAATATALSGAAMAGTAGVGLAGGFAIGEGINKMIGQQSASRTIMEHGEATKLQDAADDAEKLGTEKREEVARAHGFSSFKRMQEFNKERMKEKAVQATAVPASRPKSDNRVLGQTQLVDPTPNTQMSSIEQIQTNARRTLEEEEKTENEMSPTIINNYHSSPQAPASTGQSSTVFIRPVHPSFMRYQEKRMSRTLMPQASV